MATVAIEPGTFSTRLVLEPLRGRGTAATGCSTFRYCVSRGTRSRVERTHGLAGLVA
jgi:hypothetical protein